MLRCRVSRVALIVPDPAARAPARAVGAGVAETFGPARILVGPMSMKRPSQVLAWWRADDPPCRRAVWIATGHTDMPG
jgi:hypothetical protein